MSPDTMLANVNSSFLLLICGLLSAIVPFSWGQQKSKSDHFVCPEEFGYHPHPTDCAQYYVCVFGEAVLESCTGGLMYSHDLQTCDWPRNVGCANSPSAPESDALINGNAALPPLQDIRSRQKTPLPLSPTSSSPSSPSPPSLWNQEVVLSRQQQQQIQQDTSIPDKNLYEDDIGPVEEIETDRQQRVYRGQPPTLGQVARDRDGISRHTNALQTSAGPDKVKPVAVISFSSHHQNIRPPESVSTYILEPAVSQSPTPTRTTYNISQFEPYYGSYDEDVELYRDIDYTHYRNDNSNNNNNQGKHQSNTYQVIQHQPTPPQQHQQQQQTRGSQQLFTRQPIYDTQDYHLQKEEEDGQLQQSEKQSSSVRGRNRGSITYTTAANEFDHVTPGNGKGRPTLKPPTSIVSKAVEIDIYKFAPKRPDPIYPAPEPDKTAAKCRPDICLLPDCSCGGKDIPADLPTEETPQIVLLTFDDSVNELNKGLYADLFEKGRTNPNGCPISATFYVSHEWTDYSMVQNLYATGHEIASHSVSHSFGEQFSTRKWSKEVTGQREILSAYGGVRQEDIRGMRAPFLAIGGNKMFKMLYDANFTYDSSMPIYENKPPSWPYTLDYKIFHDCMIPPCPTRSYPGVWEVPMVMWQDLNGGRCSMGDACSNPSEADGVFKMLNKNFERHFTTNRAPFGLFYHSSWFTQAHHKEGFIAFLDRLVAMPEVWIITNWQAIQWIRDPTPMSKLNNFPPFGCDYAERPRKCNNPKVCNLWHKSGVRYLKTCQPCPDVYPWTGKTGVRNTRIDNEDSIAET